MTPPDEIDRQIAGHWHSLLRNHWVPLTAGVGEPNLVDVIAASNGWLPLNAGQQMTVHYGGACYRIYREMPAQLEEEPEDDDDGYDEYPDGRTRRHPSE